MSSRPWGAWEQSEQEHPLFQQMESNSISFGKPGDHSFSLSQTLLTQDRHFPQSVPAVSSSSPWRWWDREALESQCQSSRWGGHHLPVGCHWTASSSSPAGPGFSPSTAVAGWAPPGEQRWSQDQRQCAASPRHRWPRCTWLATSAGSLPYSWEGKRNKLTF